MLAIVKTGGKQYQLAIKNEESQAVTIGSPFVDGATVEVEVVKNFKGKKIIIFKKRRRQNSRRKNGHRQNYTQLKVVAIKS